MEKTHEAWHELPIQAMIRERLTPAGEPNRTVLLGWAGDSLGAVSSYRLLGGSNFQIDVLAVAQEFRHRGGGWALETIGTTLDYITADAAGAGAPTFTAGAWIHQDNRPSQRLFERQGFEQTADQKPEGYQVWSATFPVALGDEGDDR